MNIKLFGTDYAPDSGQLALYQHVRKNASAYFQCHHKKRHELLKYLRKMNSQ